MLYVNGNSVPFLELRAAQRVNGNLPDGRLFCLGQRCALEVKNKPLAASLRKLKAAIVEAKRKNEKQRRKLNRLEAKLERLKKKKQ